MVRLDEGGYGGVGMFLGVEGVRVEAQWSNTYLVWQIQKVNLVT